MNGELIIFGELINGGGTPLEAGVGFK